MNLALKGITTLYLDDQTRLLVESTKTVHERIMIGKNTRNQQVILAPDPAQTKEAFTTLTHRLLLPVLSLLQEHGDHCLNR